MAGNEEDPDINESPGHERHLAENCVEYYLFVIDHTGVSQNGLSHLESVRKAAMQFSESITSDYIWQREAFNLELRTGNGLAYLHGITDYGDAVEDEWLIVYMLRELSKTQANLWIRVGDSDGEFLLVEAADMLPKWLSPEMDQNRVWLHDGKMYIIPSTKSGSVDQNSQQLSLSQAVKFLRMTPGALVHSPFIEAEAFYRLGKYPEQIADAIHCSLITVPRKVAWLLHSLPESVAPAVESFYLRDTTGLKRIFSPSDPLVFPPDDLITTSTRFSKVLFAQLKSQHFDTPLIWEPLFQKIRDGKLSPAEVDKNSARLETGMKLTCGFEMLAVNAELNKFRVVRELAIMIEDLQEGEPDLLPSNEDISTWKDALRDDDEAWMDINYEDFERELEGRKLQKQGGGKSGFGDVQTQADLQKIVSRFESFLNDDDAGLEGAELDTMDVDDDDDEEYSEEDSEGEDKEVGFDEEAFSNMMREMMGLPATQTRNPPDSHTSREKNKDIDTSVKDDSVLLPAEDEEIRTLTSHMEAELNKYGALKLDVPSYKPRKLTVANGQDFSRRGPEEEASETVDEDSDAEVDIDYNLVKNLLESFKSQGGMAGPTGNLLGLMGLQLPRDELDENSFSTEQDLKGGKGSD